MVGDQPHCPQPVLLFPLAEEQSITKSQCQICIQQLRRKWQVNDKTSKALKCGNHYQHTASHFEE